MGASKASLEISGVRLGEKIANALAACCQRVVVLGREPIAGFDFLPDAEEFEGPLAALARFEPTMEWVFAAACDLTHFEPSVCSALMATADKAAVVPMVMAQLQPLCALYPASALIAAKRLAAEGRRSMMSLLDVIPYEVRDENELRAAGIEPVQVLGANTREELESLSKQRPNG
jgi:molybdopterin-guanine dinucleotide biosynthesis protein A